MNQYNLAQLGLLNKSEDEDEEEEKPVIDKPSPMGMMAKKSEEMFFKNRTVYLWGPVEDKSAKDVVSKLLLLDADKPGKEIKFYINSPGGVVTSGMVIYDVMRMIKSPVSTICMGLAASMGSILLAGGEKGKRFIFPHGEVMIHQPSLGGYFQGVSADLEIHAHQIQKTKELGAKILSEACGQPFEKVLKDLERDYWMDANDALTYGIVDKIVDKL
ncbi:ClpP family protease [Taibaiella chishuiensis]|uniref:ATP-dependent Clp protease proteolytic subunit n=1 Tax=Taibaiella chishuiensis TaxID=1434707 RepID=A0A2P8CYN0_9BACT|nr:ATP-dependent Clp protease proteolytic subunit [Taibaiella chishuiensis]PSK90070.1 ATP-dependent Clp protease proteolytic subunit ClpP [Taibaiella chishuiensis]